MGSMSQWASDSPTIYKKTDTDQITEMSPWSFRIFGILGDKVKISFLRNLHVSDFEVILEMWINFCAKNGL